MFKSTVLVPISGAFGLRRQGDFARLKKDECFRSKEKNKLHNFAALTNLPEKYNVQPRQTCQDVGVQ